VGVSAEVAYSKMNTLNIYFQINNVFNTSYQSNMSRLKYFEYYSQTPNGQRGIYGMGRNVSVKLVANF